MELNFTVEGNSSPVQEFEKFLVAKGIDAKLHTVAVKDRRLHYPEPDPDKYESGDSTSIWLKVVSSVSDLAKKIVDFLSGKKEGSITLSAGGKSKKITRKDTAGNIEEYLEEYRGTSITIKVEI